MAELRVLIDEHEIGSLYQRASGKLRFSYDVGQHQQALGPVNLYDWGFDGRRGYTPSLSLVLFPSGSSS